MKPSKALSRNFITFVTDRGRQIEDHPDPENGKKSDEKIPEVHQVQTPYAC